MKVVSARPPGAAQTKLVVQSRKTRRFRNIIDRAGIVFLSAFIIWHIFALCVWLMWPNRLREVLLPCVTPYMNAAGLWQYWGVFTPVPKDFNIYLTAQVDYADGTYSIWDFPRMENLDYFERAQKERWRKYASENILDGEHNGIAWPDCCRFIARINAEPGKVPVMVSLIKHWAYIEPPETGLHKESPEPNQAFEFYTYRVQPEDLK